MVIVPISGKKSIMFTQLKRFSQNESAPSILLAVLVVLAVIAANTPLHVYYNKLHTPRATMIINDGLMALFFLVIAIELKAEMLHGALATRAQAALPVAAALGGVVLPALVFVYFNEGEALRGWAIPMATDIAFAMGLVGVFGTRLPPGLRVFLMALAVIDDLFAIVVIGSFYTAEISWQALGMAAGIVALLFVYNRKVTFMAPFLLAGAALWIAVHESGIHSTVAGVLLGLLMPLDKGRLVLSKLHLPVAFFVVPVFVFANAGVSFGADSVHILWEPVTIGIVAGLFLGKQFGIFLTSWFMVRLRLAKLPDGVSWGQFYGICMVAGIGFTMSLFIGSLAYRSSALMGEARIGVLLGSLASAVCGGIMLAITLPAKKSAS